MKNCKKIVAIIIAFFILIYVYQPFSYAVGSTIARDGEKGSSRGGSEGTLGEVVRGADGFLSKGTNANSPINDDQLKKGSDLIYNTLLAIGVGTILIWGIVLGIQFISGSLEEKADVKKALIPFFAGCILIFGAFGIWKLILTVLQGIQ